MSYNYISSQQLAEIQRAARSCLQGNDDSTIMLDGLCPTDKIFIQHENGTVDEYDVLTDTYVPTDVQIVHPDYVSLIKQKIDEACVGVKYQSNENRPFKTESFVYDSIKSLNLGDLLKNYDFDLKSIDLSAVFLFMEHVDPEVTNKLVKRVLKDVDPAALNLHRPTLCTLALASMVGEASSEVENLKRTIFIADLVRQKVDELRAEAKAKKAANGNSDSSTHPENASEAVEAPVAEENNAEGTNGSASQENISGVVVEEQKTENNNSAVTDASTSQGNTSEEVANEPAKPEKPNRGGRR